MKLNVIVEWLELCFFLWKSEVIILAWKLAVQTGFYDFPHFLKVNAGIYLNIGHDQSHPHPFQFITCDYSAIHYYIS